MSQPELLVDSVTGVDVTLPIAGPGARSYAFVIDWHIRAVIALAWYVVAAVIYNQRLNLSAPLNPGASWFIFVIVPPAAIYFLYHPLLETLSRGRTPGKRMAGVQLVDRGGSAASVGALLTRNVFRLLDSLPVAYVVGLVTVVVTRNCVRIGDLAAGTLLVYVRNEPMPPLLTTGSGPATTLDATSAEIASELLHRWTTLDLHSRRRLALAVLRDSASEDEEDDASLRRRLERLCATATADSR
jgi:uncharacterized RDD family membrane protein YckC